eukprot:CAMPEP_0170786566 /NCGR_PEP_ID=MMETSP0733-20121128/17716_1 /TAXON_ID=186038 /ORGANISM="Fragilariopsis kerguelensis, Strain L26-C5" /LENGTH=90 /DNA_ID=CAMNT_0011132511 /DNA_START=89 /DNA_END=357 /DNA_ORIENTATION=+
MKFTTLLFGLTATFAQPVASSSSSTTNDVAVVSEDQMQRKLPGKGPRPHHGGSWGYDIYNYDYMNYGYNNHHHGGKGKYPLYPIAKPPKG